MVFLYEYLWLDAKSNLRGKTKVLSGDKPIDLKDLPVWNYDGSSTEQAEGKDSEVLIKPQAIFKDPFHKTGEETGVTGAYLVMCDTYLPSMKPHPTNSRFPANVTFKAFKHLKPRYGIEQEFFVKHRDVDGKIAGRVLGFGEGHVMKLTPAPQGQYYCSVGSNNAFGRDFIIAAFHNCLKAGLNLTGMNAEVAPGQWEFQVCADGIAAADQLYVMRYILARTGESLITLLISILNRLILLNGTVRDATLTSVQNQCVKKGDTKLLNKLLNPYRNIKIFAWKIMV